MYFAFKKTNTSIFYWKIYEALAIEYFTCKEEHDIISCLI